jgi:hypothetical protein
MEDLPCDGVYYLILTAKTTRNVHIKARTIFGETDSCFQIIWTEDLK